MNQRWSAEAYQQNAAYVPEMGVAVLGWLNPQPGERILDLGCGDGSLTETLAASGARVVAMDADASMVAAARARGLNVVQASGCAFAFAQPFDAVFSNAALHWMKPPEAVAKCVAASLNPGGRFVGEFGGAGNVASAHRALLDECRALGIDHAAVDPWYFPSPEQNRSLLEAHGFTVKRIEHFSRPTPVGSSVLAWLETFAHPFLQSIVPSQRKAFLQRVAYRVEPQLPRDGETLLLDYVRLRFETCLG